MKSYDFESQTAAAPITPEKPRMASLKKQKDVAEMALSAERKRQTIALAQKQIIKASEVKWDFCIRLMSKSSIALESFIKNSAINNYLQILTLITKV